MPDNEDPKLETIRLERPAEGVVVATLNRPARMNALAVLYEYGRRRAAGGHGDPYYTDPALVRSFLDAAHRSAGLAR